MSNISTETPDVSVILPTHNRANSLSSSIASVLSQTLNNLELIIVDDASTDNTEAIVEHFHDTRIRFSKFENNQGAAAARNFGISKARGQFVAFQDSDDIWLPRKLEFQVQLARELSQPGVVYTRFLKFSDNSLAIRPKSERLFEGDVTKDLLTGTFVGTVALLLPREALETVGPFDEDMESREDLDLMIRLARKYPFYSVNEPGFIYDQRGTLRVTSNLKNLAEGTAKLIHNNISVFVLYPEHYAQALGDLGHMYLKLGEVERGQSFLQKSLKVRALQTRIIFMLCFSKILRSRYKQWYEWYKKL